MCMAEQQCLRHIAGHAFPVRCCWKFHFNSTWIRQRGVVLRNCISQSANGECGWYCSGWILLGLGHFSPQPTRSTLEIEIFIIITVGGVRAKGGGIEGGVNIPNWIPWKQFQLLVGFKCYKVSSTVKLRHLVFWLFRNDIQCKDHFVNTQGTPIVAHSEGKGG